MFAGTVRPIACGQHRRVFADEVLVGDVVLVLALADRGDRQLRELVDLRRVEPHGAVALEGGHQLVARRRDAEHFLLGDAQQVVVVGGALDDALRGVVEVGRFVDDDRRIAGAGDDRPLAAVERRAGDGRAAGDADRRDAAVLEQRVGRVERRLGDDADEVVDPQVAVDRLVEPADALGGDALAAGVRVDDHRVAAGDHAHGVAGDRGQRVRDRRDGADDAERGVLDDAQPVVAAEALLREELDAGRALAEDAELLDLVGQPADLGFLHLHRAELDALVDRDAADVVDDAAAVVDRALARAARTPRARPSRLRRRR